MHILISLETQLCGVMETQLARQARDASWSLVAEQIFGNAFFLENIASVNTVIIPKVTIKYPDSYQIICLYNIFE